MDDDKRMYFIRNIEAFKNENIKRTVKEYEVITDADIIGEFSYGPYYFTIWEISDKKEGEARKLCLKIVESKEDKRYESAKRTGFYHGGGVADELVALTSLFLRKRLQLGSIVRIDDKPRLLSVSQDRIDKHLITGQSDLGELPEYLSLVEGLDNKYHQNFILAVRLYHRAILLIEEEPDMAYLNLVSAIEILCRNYPIDEIKLSDLDEKLSKLVSSVEKEGLRGEIEQTILKNEKFTHLIARRFNKFIVNHVEEDFWREENKSGKGLIKKEDLPELLKRIYVQRSRTLHSGEPFPRDIFEPPFILFWETPMMESEIDPSESVSAGERKWEPKDFIPYPHFFERLVNHVLKTFLMKNQLK